MPAFKRLQRLWLNLPLRRKGLVVIAIPVLALFLFSGAFFVVEQQYTIAGRWLRSALDLYGAAQQVRMVVLQEDDALQGYALTGDPAYLKIYSAAMDRQSQVLHDLGVATHGDAAQSSHVAVLSRLLPQRQRSADDFIAARGNVGADVARLNREWVQQNRALALRINSEVISMQELTGAPLKADAISLARAVWRSNVTVLLSIGVGLIGGILAMILFATGIVRRMAQLQEDANGLVNGQLETQREASTDEIGQLTEVLHGAAKLLANRTLESERRALKLAASEAEKREQAGLLQCILNSMADGVIVADHTGKLVLYNPAARKLFDVETIEDIPDRWEKRTLYLSDTVTPCPASDLPMSRAIRGESPETIGLFLPRQIGCGIWIDVTARPLREGNDAVRGGVLVCRDVSDTKHVEDTLRVARAEAEQANHAKSEFLSRMSHELRTPMNAILGFAQLLDLDTLTPPQRQSVDQILNGGRHLLTLINEVLDLARIEAGKMTFSNEPIGVGEAVQSAIDLVEPLARQRQVRLGLTPSPNWERYVKADRQRFQQVVLNLLSNAIKYNQAGGSVIVTCQVVDESRFRLLVRDTGIGLSREKIANLFKPFERLGADQSGIEGTGIGLALSKKLMNAMGGTIGAESEAGAGSTFWVELPACDCPIEEYDRLEGASDEAAASMTVKSLKVLYIEDNLSNNLLMERILQNRPEVQLISAMQGSMGLELAKQHNPDLIFLDLHLPDMNGDELLRRFRNQPATSATPVAMISADATASQVERLLAAGANQYFTKPLDIKRLLNYVDDVLSVGA